MIKGLSEVRRLPRLGKIHLGIKVKKQKKDDRCKHPAEEMCRFCSYPKEVDYFVVPKEISEVYGEKPKELDIYLPTDQIEKVFPQRLAWYSASGRLRCAGDGESAMRIFKEVPGTEKKNYRDNSGEFPDDLDLVDYPCTCPRLESGDCQRNATLNVILPKVNLGGIFQLVTGSINSIIEINSDIDYLKAILGGRCSMMPLVLLRNEQKISYQDKAPTPHWILKIEFRGNIEQRNQMVEESKRLLPPVPFALPPPEAGDRAVDRYEEAQVVEPEKKGSTTEKAAEEIPESVRSILAEIAAAAPSKVDQVFNKHIAVINSLATKWKLMVGSARDERKKASAIAPAGTIQVGPENLGDVTGTKFGEKMDEFKKRQAAKASEEAAATTDTKASESDREIPDHVVKREELIGKIFLFTHLQQIEDFRKDDKATEGLSDDDLLRIAKVLDSREKEIRGATNQDRLL